MPRLGIVHTSFALVEPLNTLAKEKLPENVDVVNIVDDTLLSYARAHGVDESLTNRMCRYFHSAVDAGADIILNACSSVGETVDVARRVVKAPILKIDDAMTEQAVSAGKKIAVLATVASTLGPTVRLLRSKAEERGADIQISEHLCDGAFDLLVGGKVGEHDAVVTEAVMKAAEAHDVIVFAQASMARLAPSLDGKTSVPIMTSPELAMNRLKAMLAEM